MAIRRRLITPVLELQLDPLQFASGYTMDLYCKYRNPDHEFVREGVNGMETFYGETFGEVLRDALRTGWQVNKSERTAVCPLCLKKLREAKL